MRRAARVPGPSTGPRLHRAIGTGDVALAWYALAQGQAVNEALDGVAPLHTAAGLGDVPMVHLLLSCGADVNMGRLRTHAVHAPGVEGSTALHFAAANGHAAVVAVLLEHGANPAQPDAAGHTPAHVARVCGHEACAQLLEQGMPPRLADDEPKRRGNFLEKATHPAASLRALLSQGSQPVLADETDAPWAARPHRASLSHLLKRATGHAQRSPGEDEAWAAGGAESLSSRVLSAPVALAQRLRSNSAGGAASLEKRGVPLRGRRASDASSVVQTLLERGAELGETTDGTHSALALLLAQHGQSLRDKKNMYHM